MNINNPDKENQLDKINSAKEKIQEKEYVKNINDLFSSNQKFIIELKEDNKAIATTTIANIDLAIYNLGNFVVPRKFKDFHLLFSRSLLQISSNSNNNKKEDLESGLLLYEEAYNNFKILYK